ncbi:tRNA synthetases class I, catalytic domain-containing protein [Melampsora americana]|nr:tRNA synthetases class I, catalytic domain-containing protein [Melampsora americana]
MSTSTLDELVIKLKKLGLPEKQAIDTARNPNLANQFIHFNQTLISTESVTDLLPKHATLLLKWSTACVSKLKDKSVERKEYGAKKIVLNDLITTVQVDAALEYLSVGDGPVDEIEFNQKCGVGVSMTKEEVKTIVQTYIKNSSLVQTSKWASLGKTTGELKKLDKLLWCNPIDLKTSVDEVFLDLFGPKQSVQPLKKTEVKSKPNVSGDGSKTVTAAEQPSEPSIFEVGMLSQLHKPGENPQTDPVLVKEHLKATGGKVITRFPPEPNGYLHIGHSKAIAINFGFAAYHGGSCNLRYDDTNPEAEEQIYLDSILDMVRWLGFEPDQITYSSDHFQRLYELAEELIKRGKAYVCFCSGAEIKANRGGEERGPRIACVHRSFTPDYSLKEFRKMKSGDYKPNEIILRMKQDLEDGNPQMWDLVAYRVLEASHHRTGNLWKIYPTYDFTHCLCDSFENITHSLCTTEFIQSRVSYEWLCHALDVYTPRQTEYGRLNLEGTVMSKRKIMKLVKEGHVEGWDDPRLYTLIALRRRGIPPEAILKFVNSLGVATSVTNIASHRFEQTIRQHLELTTPRLMMVLHPIKVVIENLPEDYLEVIERAVHPKVPEMGMIKVPFTREIYIEREDFSLIDSDDFFRLTPTKSVGLFQVPFPIKCKSWKVSSSTGEVEELVCVYENETKITKSNKPKAYIHWVADCKEMKSPVKIEETRIYKALFNSANPAGLDDFLTDINPNSLEIVKGSLIEIGIWDLSKRVLKEVEERLKKKSEEKMEKAKNAGVSGLVGNEVGFENVRFQGMRTAYFTIDKTSKLDGLMNDQSQDEGKSDDRLVLNWIVSLKEDSGKKV